MENSAKRLCFGTFASVLAFCRTEDVSQAVLLESITRTVDPESSFADPGHATTVTRLLNCERNFPNAQKQREAGAVTNRLSSVPSCTRDAKLEKVIQSFQENVLPLLDEDKKELAVLALLNIIQEDKELENSKQASFKRYFGTTKSALLEQSAFVLHDFLARAFLYTAVVVKNTVGKDCINSIDENYITGFCRDKGKIRLIETHALAGPVAEQMRTIFNGAIKNFHIIEYMNSDPSRALDGRFLDAVERFCVTIESNIIVGLIEHQKEEAYQKVGEFLYMLHQYHGYLGENLHKETDIFAPAHEEGSQHMLAFRQTVRECKQKIDALYGEINNGNTLFVLNFT